VPRRTPLRRPFDLTDAVCPDILKRIRRADVVGLVLVVGGMVLILFAR
jgi:hypothetical protein